MNFIPDAKVLTNTPDVTTFLQPTNDMHPRIENLAEAFEALKTSTYRPILFKNYHIQTFLRQNSSSEKASKSAAYDKCTFSHFPVFVYTAAQPELVRCK